MNPSEPIRHLKRKARLKSRRDGIPLHAALDAVAADEGFARWSLLAAKAPSPVAEMYGRLAPGDLLLIGARPGQGKTLMGFRLALEALRSGRRSAVFTLEYSERDLARRLDAVGAGRADFAGSVSLDCSDAIDAAHIVGALGSAPSGSFVLVDYLQLLDQRRDTPDLSTQVRLLRDFARRTGVILAFTSQIDRRFEESRKPFPDLRDVRLPNPLDLALFDKACFLNRGAFRFRALH